MPRPQRSFIQFLVDISGVPRPGPSGTHGPLIMACVSVDTFKLDDMMNTFRNQFPSIWDKKGHQLSMRQLEDVVDFLNGENVRMITIRFDDVDWQRYKAMYPGEGHFEEKVMAILYYYVLRRVAWKDYLYPVLVDNDTSFKISQSIVICNRLARYFEHRFDISFGYLSVNPELRFPDWIASARRKLSHPTLAKYKHFIIVRSHLAPQHLLISMKKSFL